MNFSIITPSGNHVACGGIRNTLHTVGARVDAQRRHTVAGVCVPNLDAVVLAATGNLLAIWAEANTPDFPVKCSIVSTHHTFEN
jgi:hypothetical protein